MLRKASQRPTVAHLQSLRDELLAPDSHGRDLLESQTLDQRVRRQAAGLKPPSVPKELLFRRRTDLSGLQKHATHARTCT